jgi:hypothetical protein
VEKDKNYLFCQSRRDNNEYFRDCSFEIVKVLVKEKENQGSISTDKQKRAKQNRWNSILIREDFSRYSKEHISNNPLQ